MNKPAKKYGLSATPEQNLMQVILADNASLSDRAACQIELDKRRWRRDFWSKGIVAWIALCIASASLIWQIMKELK